MDGSQSRQSIIENIISHIDLFLEQLRLDGFHVGIDTHHKVQLLLFRLTEQGALPKDTPLLCEFLSALICTSAREQQLFRQKFEQWSQGLMRQSDNVSMTKKLSPDVRKIWFRSRLLLLTGVIMILFAIGYFCARPHFTHIQNPAITDNKMPEMPKNNMQLSESENQELTQVTITSKRYDKPGQNVFSFFSILLIIIGCIVLWLTWWRYQADRFLSRQATRESVIHKPFYMETLPQALFKSLMMIRTARKFRQHIKQPSNRLDADATVYKTCNNGGRFSPVYGMIQTIPEYLVLVDQTTFDDHQARWVDALLDHLEDNDVFVERFYFRGTPHLCYPRQQDRPPVNLAGLAGKYPDHRMIIFTDAEFFVHPVSGQLASWINDLSAWPVRAVFIPAAAQEAAFRRQALEASDFIVMPASERGMASLVENLHQPNIATSTEDESDSIYPNSLRGKTGEWLHRYPPSDTRIDEMMRELTNYLGQSAMLWLSACAIFPGLHRNLTVFLGNKLSVLNETDLLKLSRLPWFRYNAMPNWLRRRLLFLLPEEQENRIREAIKENLDKNITREKKEESLIFSRFKHGFAKRWFRSVLRAIQRKSSEDSEWRDFIFIQFLENRLTFRISKKMHQVLGPEWSFKRIVSQLFKYLCTVLVLFSLVHWGPLWIDTLSKELFKQKELQSPVQPENVLPKPVQDQLSKKTDLSLDQFTNSLEMTFVRIPNGTFMMGSPETEKGRDNDESPQHKVTISRDFFMQTTEVTQKQWKAVMGENPSYFKNCGDNCPVEQVSWNDVQEFIRRLNKKSKQEYRLPTEAEWEYAARAGSTSAFANGDIKETGCELDPNLDKMGWYCGNSNSKTHPIAQKQANKWNLYDMHGNVYEWCSDWYGDYTNAHVTNPVGAVKGSSRVFRGGSWYDTAGDCRSAFRNGYEPTHRIRDFGFRLVVSQASGEKAR